jgi:hypothetical protein
VQPGRLGGGLHALRDRGQPERLDQPEDGRGDPVLLRVGVQVGDQRPVDLDGVHELSAHVADGGVARAEVVDGHADTAGAQLLQGQGGLRVLAHQLGLGDLQHQVGGVAADPVEPLQHLVGEGGGAQFERGDVDVHRELAAAEDPRPPPGDLGDRGFEHPDVQWHHQPGVLGDRDEPVGGEQPADRVLPPHQRLDAGDPPAGQLDDRLVAHLQLTVVDRVAQLIGQSQPAHRARVHGRLEELHAAAATALGHVHRGVRVAQQGVRGQLRLGQSDPDAGADPALLRPGLDRALQGRLDPGRDVDDPIDRGVADHDRELVAAEPGHGVDLAHDAPDPVGHLDQQAVADAVPEAVVDHLEPVQVQHQHGGQPGAAVGAGDGPVDAVGEQRAVGQAGERVVEGQQLQLPVRLGHLHGAFGDPQLHVLCEHLELLGQHVQPDDHRVDPVLGRRGHQPGGQLARSQLDDQLDHLVEAFVGVVVSSGAGHRSTTPAQPVRT